MNQCTCTCHHPVAFKIMTCCECHNTTPINNTNIIYEEPVKTLRDEVAIAAITGLLSNRTKGFSVEDIITDALNTADAYMQARNKSE